MLDQVSTNSKSLHYYASLQTPQEIGSSCIISSKSMAQMCYFVSHIMFRKIENHEEFVRRINIIVQIT
jgi:hypothetical protein